MIHAAPLGEPSRNDHLYSSYLLILLLVVVIIDLWASLWTKPYKARRSPPCFAPEYGLERLSLSPSLSTFSPVSVLLACLLYSLCGTGEGGFDSSDTTYFQRLFPLFEFPGCERWKCFRKGKRIYKREEKQKILIATAKGHDDTSRRSRHQPLCFFFLLISSFFSSLTSSSIPLDYHTRPIPILNGLMSFTSDVRPSSTAGLSYR